MRPAQKRRRKSAVKDGKKGKLLFILAVLLVVASFFLFLRLQTRFWSGREKLSMAIPNPDGSVSVATFDPRLGTVNEIIIPANTQVSVASQLGTWKIKSVWQLGINEKKEGSLLVKTVSKNFYFPVYVWADSQSRGFVSGDFPALIKSLFGLYKTNLGVGDRLHLAAFSLKVKNPDRIVSDLSRTAFLKKTRLVDGEEGYVVFGSPPEKISAVFSDTETFGANTRLAIKDATSAFGEAERVGRIIETFGAKVSSVSKTDSLNTNCEVRGINRAMVRKVSMVFSCTQVVGEIEGSFDLEIILGEEFPQNF